MKKLLSVLLVFVIVLAFASCGKKGEDVTEPSSDEQVTEEINTETEAVSESETEAVTQESAKEEESKSEVETSAAEEESSEAAEEASVVAAPQNTKEIIALYNTAVNNAYSKKAGFSKERYTDNANFDMSVALKPFKGLVEKFVGIGEDNKYSEKVAKGNWDGDAKRHYLRKSTLSEADITSAKCEQDGGVYTLIINVKPGSSVGNKNQRSTSAPIDKCGICVGKEDKNYYDHKTAEVIYDAIAGTYEGADIKENYKNAKIVAEIDAVSGELVGLTVTYDISVAIDIGIGSGTATGTTHIIYKDFKY
ncbi:MAG: hypothetical protein IJM02_05395 [Clostridia bacterium]|nr:hypothetical protein [Clostridia bacterium]